MAAGALAGGDEILGRTGEGRSAQGQDGSGERQGQFHVGSSLVAIEAASVCVCHRAELIKIKSLVRRED
jgi:hypothetical protein